MSVATAFPLSIITKAVVKEKEGILKKNISKIAICVLLAFFVMVTSVRAEEPKREKREEKTELQEIVVTPTGKIEDESKAKVPAVVETLTPEGIERINAIDTADIFKYMPGSYLRKLYPGSTNSPLVIRGNNSTMTARTLVVADDAPISDFTAAGNSNAPKWQMVTPGEIETMEMIYGPYSAALSGNSMSGSAIITTRMPEKFETGADFTYTFQNFREYETNEDLKGYTANAYVGHKLGPFSFMVSANRLETRAQGTSYMTLDPSNGGTPSGNVITGWTADRDPKGNRRYIVGAQGMQDIKNTTVKVKLAYDFNPESQVRFTLARWDSMLNRDSPETYLRDASGMPVYSGTVDIDGKSYALKNSTFSYSKGDLQDSLYGLTYKLNPKEGFKLSAGVTHYSNDRDITGTSSDAPPAAGHGGNGSVSENDNGWYTADFKGSYDIKCNGIHTVGAGYHYDRYYVDNETWNATDWRRDIRTTLKSASQGKTQTQAVFLDDTWEITNQWSLYLGGRYEWWKGFGASKALDVTGSGRLSFGLPSRSENDFSPKFSATFKPTEDWRLRFSMALAVRYPTVGELYQGGVSASGIDNKADPNLKPERVNAKDFTITRTLGKAGEARLTFFQDDVDDAIFSQTNTTVTPNVTNYQNVGKVRTRGVEIAVNMPKFFSGFGVFTNLAWTDSEILSNRNNPESEGKTFPRVPTWRAKCVLDYSPSDRWFVTLAGHYSGRQYGTLDNSDRYGGYGGIDDYLIFDTKMSYKVTDYLTASIGVDNITDQLVHVSHPYPRRTYFASLKYTY